MKTLAWLIVLVGLVPAAIGYVRCRSRERVLGPTTARTLASSAMLCALAFNLTFLWQEIWLVVPKALVPGVHPILYHNDHEWTGTAPSLELLQATGAVATLVSGIVAYGALRLVDGASATWRLFLFWLAFQGVDQSLTQFAVGALVPRNDVGRALTALGMHDPGHFAVLVGAVVLLASGGRVLSRALPVRATLAEIVWPALLSIVLVIPFRAPREAVEVVFVPVLTTVVGLGWLLTGVAVAPLVGREPAGTLGLVWPATALIVTLVFFQFVLRPGIPF